MEFRIERRELADAVAWGARVLPARSPVPVLGGLLLDASDGRPRVSGLDYEASARIEVETQTVRPGQVPVMGRRLLDVCRVLPDGLVDCAVEGSRSSVVGGGARFGLSVLPLEDCPALLALALRTVPSAGPWPTGPAQRYGRGGRHGASRASASADAGETAGLTGDRGWPAVRLRRICSASTAPPPRNAPARPPPSGARRPLR